MPCHSCHQNIESNSSPLEYKLLSVSQYLGYPFRDFYALRNKCIYLPSFLHIVSNFSFLPTTTFWKLFIPFLQLNNIALSVSLFNGHLCSFQSFAVTMLQQIILYIYHFAYMWVWCRIKALK